MNADPSTVADGDPADGARRVVPVGHGHQVVIRPLRPSDRPGLESLFGELPLDDLRLRFFSGCVPGNATLEHWFATDEHALGRLVADEDGELIADAGWYRLGDGPDAEFDITVAPHHRGWLGPLLLDTVVADARRHGVRNLVAEVDRSNGPMLALLRERGYITIGNEDASITRVAIGAEGPVPVWSDRRPGIVRLVVEGRGFPWGAEDWARTYGAELVGCHLAAAHGRSHCPALAGEPCPLAEGAEAVIVSLPSTDDRAAALLAAHEQLHPTTRRFVTGWRQRPPDGTSPLDRVDPAGVASVLHQLGAPVALVRRRPPQTS